MHVVRTSGAAAAAALVTMGLAAGGAQAGTENVVPAIRHQERTEKRAAASENLKHVKIRTRAEARRAEPKFRALVTTLDAAATAVSRSSTDSSTQRRGKADWVRGTRAEGHGFMQFDYVLKDLARGDHAAAKREVLRAEKTILGAGRTLIRADKLLKLKVG